MKIALVGVGGWGKNLARVLSELQVLCAVCDSDSTKASEFAQKYSVNYYDSVGSLIESEEFDGAIVATPTSTHNEIATKLLQAKKHTFVEKPLTCDATEGEKLAEIAKKNKVVLTCGYIERFNPAVGIVKDYVKEKKFGDLIMLEFHRENRMPTHIHDSGIIHDTAVHDIDTANWLFDDTPHVIFARSGQINHEYEDFASIMLGYKDNKIAIITTNWVTPKKLRKFSAVCSNAVIMSDFISQEVIIEKEQDSQTVSNERKEPLKLEIQSFLEAIEQKNELVVKPQEAVNVTMIAEAALLSSQQGVPIYLNLK